MAIASNGLLRFLISGCLMICGCSEAVRSTAVPAELRDKTSVQGISTPIRYWGDRYDSALLEDLTKAIAEHPIPADPQDENGPGIGGLALSGGGDCGAFGAGLLCGWTDHGDRPRFRVVTGVSTGALIAPLAFLGREYDPALRKAYTTVSKKDLFTMRAFIDWMRFDSIADSAPLRAYATTIVNDEIIQAVAREHAKGRRLYIQTVNLDAQRAVIWDMGAIASSGSPDASRLFLQIMVASASVPGVFPPQYIKVHTEDGKVFDEMHVDGGIVSQILLHTLPIDLSELRSRIAVPADRRTRIYVIRNGWMRPEWAHISPRLVPIARRAISTMIMSQAEAELELMYLRAREAQMDFFLCYIPDDYHRNNWEDFNTEEKNKLFDQGYEMAKNGSPWAAAPPRYLSGVRPATVPAPSN